MTCGEFLQVLIDNPEKELKFRRLYDSKDNGKLESSGFVVLQRLGGMRLIEVTDKEVLIEVNQYE